MPESESPEPKNDWQPNEATLRAWEAQAYMLELSLCPPDSEKAEQAKRKADAAFAEMYALTYPALISMARARYTATTEEIDDVIQETYIRAYRHLPKFKGDAQVGTWLRSIVNNRFIDHFDSKRKEAKRMIHPIGDESYEDLIENGLRDNRLGVEATVVQNDQVDEILESIKDLRPVGKAAVYYSLILGLTHKEIVERTGVGLSASKLRLKRAMDQLREKANRHPDTEQY